MDSYWRRVNRSRRKRVPGRPPACYSWGAPRRAMPCQGIGRVGRVPISRSTGPRRRMARGWRRQAGIAKASGSRERYRCRSADNVSTTVCHRKQFSVTACDSRQQERPIRTAAPTPGGTIGRPGNGGRRYVLACAQAGAGTEGAAGLIGSRPRQRVVR